jgi:hypothetical protein
VLDLGLDVSKGLVCSFTVAEVSIGIVMSGVKEGVNWKSNLTQGATEPRW